MHTIINWDCKDFFNRLFSWIYIIWMNLRDPHTNKTQGKHFYIRSLWTGDIHGQIWKRWVSPTPPPQASGWMMRHLHPLPWSGSMQLFLHPGHEKTAEMWGKLLSNRTPKTGVFVDPSSEFLSYVFFFYFYHFGWFPRSAGYWTTWACEYQPMCNTCLNVEVPKALLKWPLTTKAWAQLKISPPHLQVPLEPRLWGLFAIFLGKKMTSWIIFIAFKKK